MRQLDLFGPFFDTTPQENQPAEKPVVEKKEDESSLVAEPGAPYSKNALRSERPFADNIPLTNKAVETAKAIVAVTPSPLILSLFDAPAVSNESNQHTAETTEVVIETLSSTPINEETAAQNATEPISIEVAEPEVLIIEEPSEIALVTPDTEPVTEVKKKVVPKPQKQKVPELQTNGSVVFDDGKISVKIKNKSPFPAPIVKEKKEKVKKLPQKRGRKSFKEIDAEVDLIEIPDDEILFQKQYYPISEVAKWFRVNTSLIRFWENEFDVLKPRKNRKGDRLFRPEDVKNLQLIYQLLRQRKYTVEGAKEYIKTNKKKADVQLQLTNTLQKFKSFLLDMKANLQS